MNDTAIETTMAYAELKKLRPGETCAYEALRAVMGCDPQGDGYGYVSTARKRVERELECVLEAVPNIGIKRLVAKEVVHKGSRDLAHVRRSVRAGLRRQVTLVPIEGTHLSEEERKRFHLQMACMGALKLATAPRTVKRIAEAVNTQQISAAETLRLAAAPRQMRHSPKAGESA